MSEEPLARERAAREHCEAAIGKPYPLTREAVRMPDGGGWIRMDVVPTGGVEPTEQWLKAVPARSRLRLTRRFETRYVHPIPEQWHEMSPEWIARMWDGAELA